MHHTKYEWKVLVRWTYITDTWIHLKGMHKSYPDEMAECEKSRGTQDEPTFIWWVPYSAFPPADLPSRVRSCSPHHVHVHVQYI